MNRTQTKYRTYSGLMETDQSQWNALLFSSAKDGNAHEVSSYLKKGADPNTIQDNQSAIGIAAKYGDLEVVQILINSGADVNLPDIGSGCTALTHACSNGHVSTVKVLIDAGADIEASDRVSKKTPLMYASHCGQESVVELLINSGAVVDAPCAMGVTSLMYASQGGYQYVVKFLLDSGANPDARDSQGWTALMYVSRLAHTSVMKLLIEAGANVNLSSNQYGRTALMCACQSLSSSVYHINIALHAVTDLLRAGADPSAADSEGKTFINHAPETCRNQVQELSARENLLYKTGQMK